MNGDLRARAVLLVQDIFGFRDRVWMNNGLHCSQIALAVYTVRNALLSQSAALAAEYTPAVEGP